MRQRINNILPRVPQVGTIMSIQSSSQKKWNPKCLVEFLGLRLQMLNVDLLRCFGKRCLRSAPRLLVQLVCCRHRHKELSIWQ